MWEALEEYCRSDMKPTYKLKILVQQSAFNSPKQSGSHASGGSGSNRRTVSYDGTVGGGGGGAAGTSAASGGTATGAAAHGSGGRSQVP
ncbi:hypothetical protein Agub_g6562, partial [Astrephomene gubernaculifera]